MARSLTCISVGQEVETTLSVSSFVIFNSGLLGSHGVTH